MTENPSVNRSLVDTAFDHIDHALGRPVWPTRETRRNHFAVESGSALAYEFDASSFWRLRRSWQHMAFYQVTPAGRSALAQHLRAIGDGWSAFQVTFDGHSWTVPARTHGRARYSVWLSIADCWPDLEFGKFVKSASVRRVA